MALPGRLRAFPAYPSFPASAVGLVRAPAVTLERLAELLEAALDELVALRAGLEGERSNVLSVEDVQARYRLADARAARDAMRASGGAFTVARRLLVHRATLEAWELEQARDPLPPVDRRRSRARAASPSSRLPDGFWKAGRGGS